MADMPAPEAEEKFLLPLILIVVAVAFAILIYGQREVETGGIPSIPMEDVDGAGLSSSVLTSWFDGNGYSLSDVRDGVLVPNVSIKTLPKDMRSIVEVDQRKALFFQIILPLVLKTNQEISAERATALTLAQSYQAGTWTDDELASFEFLADKYGVDDLSVELSERLEVLLSRVDVIPVDLALAQAAEESAWGMSRFARDGNALFGQWTWNEKAGLIPEEQRAGQSYAVRAFRSLLDSVRAYAFNLNTHWAYADFRAQRADGVKTGDALAGTLLMYSERREAYVQSLRALMRVNSLHGLAGARMDPSKTLSDMDPYLVQG